MTSFFSAGAGALAVTKMSKERRKRNTSSARSAADVLREIAALQDENPKLEEVLYYTKCTLMLQRKEQLE